MWNKYVNKNVRTFTIIYNERGGRRRRRKKNVSHVSFKLVKQCVLERSAQSQSYICSHSKIDWRSTLFLLLLTVKSSVGTRYLSFYVDLVL